VWETLLTADEAQLFRSTWDGFGESKAGLDWPDRAEACWNAVEKLREKSA
jgi:hypothetical protein